MTPVPSDAMTLVVPLWGAIAVAGGILSTIVVLVAWIFTTFETKLASDSKHSTAMTANEGTSNNIEDLWKSMNKVAQDVSYIRGRMEPKD